MQRTGGNGILYFVGRSVPAADRHYVMRRGADDFHLIDLASQAYAVQQHLRGRPASEKLAWLSERGEVVQVYKADARGFPDTYLFRSRLGLEVGFFLRDDQFVFIGDNTTWVAPEPTGGVA